MKVRIGVDIGGTKIALGAVDADGNILKKTTFPTTPAAPEATINEIIAQIQALDVDAESVGIGVAGTIRPDTFEVIQAANLRWHSVDLVGPIEKAIGAPVRVVNDADAAGWGEYKFGAGAGKSSAVTVTVGTGIGGAAVIGDRLLSGASGLAAEFGHFILVPGGLPCGCGRRGCWEQYCSGSRITALAAQRMGDVPLGGGKIVTERARQGDEVALSIFEEVGDYLGQGLANLVMILDPDVFVIGGGVSEAGELLLAPARKALREYLGDFEAKAEVVAAKIGQDAGLIGAADLGSVR